MLGNLNLEMIDQHDHSCCDRTIINVDKNNDDFSSNSSEEYGLIDITT
jgi:hypothetical protein